jgi:hypothetical protein
MDALAKLDASTSVWVQRVLANDNCLGTTSVWVRQVLGYNEWLGYDTCLGTTSAWVRQVFTDGRASKVEAMRSVAN